MIDRSITEKNGYRAKHLIVREPLGRFEIQLRSYLQDRWSNVVEKIADRHGLEIKYGGGEPRIQQQLLELAKDIAKVEEWESVCQVRPESWPLDGTHGMRFELVREGVVLRDAGSLSAAQQMQQNIDRLTWKPDLQLRSFRAIALDQSLGLARKRMFDPPGQRWADCTFPLVIMKVCRNIFTPLTFSKNVPYQT